MLNNCNFIGTLGRDPEKKTTANFEVVNFSLAVTEKWKNKAGGKQEDTQWINCVAFGNLCNIITNYTKKGSKVYVETKFKLDIYRDKDGNEKKSAKFNVNKVILLGDSKGKSNSNYELNKSQSPLKTDLDDDIPF